MKKLILAFSLFATLLGSALQASVSIVPMPQKCIEKRGNFTVNDKTVITLSADNEEMRNAVSFWNDLFATAAGFSLEVSSTPRSSNVIRCRLNASLPNEEAYRLTVSSSAIQIDAKSPKGIFYAFQTLRQLLPAAIESGKPVAENIKWNIPCVVVEDSPAFSYRGVMLDVSRHFIPKEDVKRHIDMLAFHKLNIFHWHLTDDQGWRMESRSHPELNAKGAYRDGTIIGRFPGTGLDSTVYGGYYTIEQMKEVVAYAAARYITVVPEIDMPGHCMAVLAAYPQFGTEPEKPVKPAVTWGIFNRENNVLAPGAEVFQFLEDVFNELMDIFPGRYIHMGADECAHKWWKESPAVQAFILSNGLKDEKGLQRYFAQRVSDVITARGREAIGWDEMVDNGLVDGTVVMSWRNANGAYKAAARGHKAILTPLANSYFNVQQREKEDSLFHNMKVVSLDKVYKFEPVPDSLSALQAARIIGGQGCMWTEYFPTVEKLEYAVFPRMSAIAEVYWSDKRVKNWPGFLLKLPVQFDRYDLWGAGYSSYVFDYECFSRK